MDEPSIEQIERTTEELGIISADSLKAALLSVNLDVLSIAQSLKSLVSAKRDQDKLKAIDIILKVRGDYVVAPIDNRPVNINIGEWGVEVEEEQKKEET